MRWQSHQSLDFWRKKWTLSPEMLHYPPKSPFLTERVHFLILPALPQSPDFGKVHFPDGSQSPLLKDGNCTFSPSVSLLSEQSPPQSLDFGEKKCTLSHAMVHHFQLGQFF